MTSKEGRIDDWALAAYKAIDKDWERCDEEGGRECAEGSLARLVWHMDGR